jgi:hypothetical protein
LKTEVNAAQPPGRVSKNELINFLFPGYFPEKNKRLYRYFKKKIRFFLTALKKLKIFSNKNWNE